MIYLLLIIYQLKHFICDYPLQTPYMLGKFKSGWAWVLPLTTHAGVHAVATFLIALCFKPELAFKVALFDMVIHFTMDRIKASPNMLGRYKAISKDEYTDRSKMIASLSNAPVPRHPEIQLALNNAQSDFAKAMKSNTYFWWSLGSDQGVHHLTHYVIIWMLLR